MNLKELPENIAPYAIFPAAIVAMGEIYVRLPEAAPGYHLVSWALAIAISCSAFFSITKILFRWPKLGED